MEFWPSIEQKMCCLESEGSNKQQNKKLEEILLEGWRLWRRTPLLHGLNSNSPIKERRVMTSVVFLLNKGRQKSNKKERELLERAKISTTQWFFIEDKWNKWGNIMQRGLFYPPLILLEIELHGGFLLGSLAWAKWLYVQ